MRKIKLLWADDEIDLLKPHIMLLEQKGYAVDTAVSGSEAIEMVEENLYDVIFLDENMPGLTGLETLAEIKKNHASLPVVMITKSEEEYLMDDAIGSQITDYLIKPVNPKQILLSLKKIIDSNRLISEKVTNSYRQGFMELSSRVNDQLNDEEWKALYKDLIYWELELAKSSEESMQEILMSQKQEANKNFARYIDQNYAEWINDPDHAPVMSHNVIARKVAHILRKKERPTVLVVIDNLRFDQWKFLQSFFMQGFDLQKEEIYCAILPTATQYARNAMFAGLMPLDIQKRFGNKWLNDEDEGGKNQYEEDFLADLLQRLRLDIRFSYQKIIRLEQGKQLAENAKSLVASNDLLVVVYNFIDMLSHARTDMEVIKELAEDEAAYRSLTKSWFEHSPLREVLDVFAGLDVNLLLTTDHGSIRVKHPVQIVGDRNTTTNLRYKQGRNLKYNYKEVIEFRNPEKVRLPKSNISSVYVMSEPEDYFVYPNNQNYYVNFYRNTFQHGGVSMEEMLVPFIELTSKK
ncbi:PglZ domain-containing protein [bacterium]|nr:PglZ domain-containing protein [bacterium]